MNLITQTTRVAVLRKMAEKAKIKGWENLERKELIKVLTPTPKTSAGKKGLTGSGDTTTPEPAPKKPTKPKPEPETKNEVYNSLARQKRMEKLQQEMAEIKEQERNAVVKEEKPKDAKAQRMKEHLAKQKKVSTIIPLGKDEKMGTTEPVTLNGYRLNIQKGVYVEVPKQVAEVIMKSEKQTRSALSEGLNLDNPNHPKKLSGEGLKGELS